MGTIWERITEVGDLMSRGQYRRGVELAAGICKDQLEELDVSDAKARQISTRLDQIRAELPALRAELVSTS